LLRRRLAAEIALTRYGKAKRYAVDLITPFRENIFVQADTIQNKVKAGFLTSVYILIPYRSSVFLQQKCCSKSFFSSKKGLFSTQFVTRKVASINVALYARENKL